MKKCKDCGESKPLDEYFRDTTAKDGRWVRCKPCAKTRAKTHKIDPDKRRAAQHRWNTSPAGKERIRRYEQSTKAKERVRKWREDHPEYFRTYQAEYYAANREREKAKAQAWREANPEKRKASRDPEKYAVYNARRRSRLAGVEHEDYTRIEIFERDGGTCRLCQVVLVVDNDVWEIDHIIPISRGGPDTPANLQLTCRPCNRKKGTATRRGR